MNPETVDIGALLSGIEYLLPEIILSVTLFLIIVQDLIRKNWQASLLIYLAGIITALVFSTVTRVDTEPWSSLLSLDSGSYFAKWIIGTAGILTGIMHFKSGEEPLRPGEYFALLVTVQLGAFLATSSGNFLVLVISLELISIPSYILTGFSFNRKGTEGALKYFLFGAASTAVFLYGISFFYGFTGEFSFSDISVDTGQLIAVYGSLTLILAGILFKIAAVPMHIWLPDVYESAPTPVVAFFSVVPKIAGLVILGRLAMWSSNVLGDEFIVTAISVVAIVSMIAGNFGALRQDNAKRMMGYSTIAHSGFLMIAILPLNSYGIGNMYFYLAIYTLMNYGVFVLLDDMEKQGGVTEISDMSGLGKVLPLAGGLLLVHLISLTGLPPTSGFLAKFLVFSSVWESFSLTGEGIYLTVLIIAILNTVIALFYYLKIPFRMFLTSDIRVQNFTLSGSVYISVVLALMVLIFFFAPGLLIEVFNNVNFVL